MMQGFDFLFIQIDLPWVLDQSLFIGVGVIYYRPIYASGKQKILSNQAVI